MVIKVPLWGRLAIVVTIVAGLVGLLVFHLASQAYVIPNCVRLHTGQVFVDVPYSPDVLTYVPDSATHSVQIRFYRTALIKAHVREPFFVLRIGEHSALFEPVDTFINSPDPGPKYTEKVSFNWAWCSIRARQATLYEIPYANRTIGIEYSTEDLTADEVPVVEAMMNKIKITTADSDYKGEATVEDCTASKGLSGIFWHDPDQLTELVQNDVLRGRLSKYLVRECLRQAGSETKEIIPDVVNDIDRLLGAIFASRFIRSARVWEGPRGRRFDFTPRRDKPAEGTRTRSWSGHCEVVHLIPPTASC